MARRHASYTFPDLLSFIEQHQNMLVHGNFFIPADALQGEELANEIKLDLILPNADRVGPIKGQIIHRDPSGGVALRLPNLQDEAGAAFEKVFDGMDALVSALSKMGKVVDPASYEDLKQRLSESEARADTAEQRIAELEAQVAAGIPMAAPAASGGPQPQARTGRGFAVPDVRDLEPALQGSIGDRTFRDAIIQLSIEQVTGLMTVRQPDGLVRYGFWFRGGPVGWRTDPIQEHEVLGSLLYKAGQITKEQVAVSLEQMKAQGIRQGEAFIEMGLMSFTQLTMVLGKQVEYLLQHVMRGTEGTWEFHLLDTLPEQFLPPPLKVPALLYRALHQVVRELDSDKVAEQLRPSLDRYVQFSQDFINVAKNLKLSKEEKRFVEVVGSKSWRMREIFSVSPLSRLNTAATIWAFSELGFFDFKDTEDDERYLARVRQLIQRKQKQIHGGTLFDILDLHWISLPDEVRNSYGKLSEEFNPGNFKTIPAEMSAQLKEIRDEIDKAYEIIVNDTRRREYRKGKVEDFLIVQSAALLAKKGEMAIMRQDRPEAVNCFAKAVELVPVNGEYKEGLRRASAIV
jgi:hypothetical protein